MGLKFDEIKESKMIRTYIQEADKVLGALGYTDHSTEHVLKVSENAARILTVLGYDENEAELARIAGYMHDIGNIVNRHDHSQTGAVMAFQILHGFPLTDADIAVIVSAIGSHDGEYGIAVNPVSAAIIIADKTDVRRSRVRKGKDVSSMDIHDRVNYSVVESHLEIAGGVIKFVVEIDIEICCIMSYFELFLTRMLMCKNAADFLGVTFAIEVNGTKLL